MLVRFQLSQRQDRYRPKHHCYDYPRGSLARIYTKPGNRKRNFRPSSQAGSLIVISRDSVGHSNLTIRFAQPLYFPQA